MESVVCLPHESFCRPFAEPVLPICVTSLIPATCSLIPGLDSLELLLAAGPAEPFRPLAAVASGGESARLMLALKAAPSCSKGMGAGAGVEGMVQLAGDPGTGSARGLSEGQEAASAASEGQALYSEAEAAAAAAAGMGAAITVLDEIDSGIGSRLGAPIGVMLRRMAGLPAPATSAGTSVNGARGVGGPGAGGGQIICVTHLAQVACHAEQHICVSKRTGMSADGRVTTRFMALESDEARITEVAAMMGMGPAVAANVLASARASAASSLRQAQAVVPSMFPHTEDDNAFLP